MMFLLFLLSSLLVYCNADTQAGSDNGPPILRFVKQPPLRVDFSNSTGTTIVCTATENVIKPTVAWIFPDGSKVSNVTGLRQVYPDGTLTLNQFGSELFRQDVHAVTYKCLATGTTGSLLSNEVKVKAVMDVDYEAHVYDEFVMDGNTAVIKCHIPQFLKEYVTVVSFIKDDSLKIGAESNFESKYFLHDGSLYITNVGAGDARGQFKCQTYNKLTKQLKTSSNIGTLIVTDPHGKIVPRITNSLEEFTVNAGDKVLVPCVAQGKPKPHINWSIKDGGAVLSDKRIMMTDYGLIISNVELSDEAVYVCLANSTAGTGQSTSRMIVKGTIDVRIVPPSHRVNVGSSVTFECSVTSYTQSYKINWFKDGRPVNYYHLQKFDQHKIHIANVSLDDKGIYQCFVNVGEDEQAQGVAQLLLAKFGPVFLEVFNEEMAQPASAVALTCLVAANPQPQIEWSIDGTPILPNNRIIIDDKLTADGNTMSTLSIKSVELEDGGTYICTAINEIDRKQHMRRVNVYGPLRSRVTPTVNVVAGQKALLNCPIYGYPIDSISWEKDSVRLPIDARQRLLRNWTMSISDVQRGADSGKYTCTATNKAQQVAIGHLQMSVMVLPKIAPFEFQEDLVREGMRAQIQCAVSEGDIPLTLSWMKDGHFINNTIHDVFINQVDEYSSNLAIRFVSPKHNGNYTCIVSNKAGVATHTAQLSVNGKVTVNSLLTFYIISALPKIIPFSFQDDQNFKGMRAHITCAVSQGDLPLTFFWLKDGLEIGDNLSQLGVQVANYDQYSSFLSIQSVTSDISGNYTCIVINEAGKDSYSARLMVQAPKIVPFQFQGESVLEGVFVRVSCVVYQGDLPIDIQWNKDGKIINNNLKGATVRTVDDFTSILTIDYVTVEHSGNYSCLAKNSAATAVQVAQLIVKVPPKIVPFTFQEDELAEGTFVRVTCVAGRGDLPLNFSWKKDENALPVDVTVRQIDDYSSVLSIDSVLLKHSGVYTCIASNKASTTAHSSTLRVFVPPKWTKIPDAVVVAGIGSNVALTCEADGHPKPIVTWMTYESSEFDTSTKLESIKRYSIYENGTMMINNVQESDGGRFICAANNGIGKSLSRITELIIQVPLAIVNKSHDVVVRLGGQMILRCVVRSDKPINSSWSINGKMITEKNTQRYTLKQFLGEGSLMVVELSVASVSKLDNAEYGCHVDGKNGRDEAIIKVTVEGPPETPADVSAVSAGGNSIEVTWTTPFDNYSPIYKYVVVYETKGGNLYNRSTHGPETKLLLEELQPSSKYYITVYAENANGRSLSGGSTEVVVTGEAPSGVPEHITVQPHNGRSLRVSWKPPMRSTWNGAIIGYYVGYREAATSQPYDYHLLEIPEGYDKGLSYALNELKEFTSYSVVVQAFNEHGKGPLSEEVLAMTSEGVPSRPPMAIDCSPTSSQTIVVNWDQPQEAYIHGILRGYKVLYWTADTRNGAVAASLSIQNTTDIKVTLRNLLQFANYSIQVLAYTFAGDGIASKPIYCHTLEDVPSSPRDIKAVDASSDSALISWAPPVSANGIITHYTIYIQEIHLQHERFAKHRETRLVLNGNKTFHKVDNLRRGQRYAFHVTASTSAGEGTSTKSVEVDLSAADSKVRPRVMAFGGIIRQEINKPVVLPCPSADWSTTKRSWFYRNDPINSEDPRITIQPDGALQVTTLYYSDSGNYTCVIFNDFGEDKITYEIYVKIPPSAPSIIVSSSTDNNVEISWKTPSSTGNSPILGYILNYKQELGSWTAIDLQPYMSSYTVTGLQCGSTYQMTLSAVNAVGVGQTSDTVIATTTGQVPSVPQREKLIEERTAHAILHLDSWLSNGCPILYFVVEYKPRSSRSWLLYSNEIRPNRPSILLENLQPSAWYTLRMAAHTSAGSSVAEFDFQTLDSPEGELNDGDAQSKSNGFFSIFDMNVTVTVVSCAAVVLLCSAITFFWVKRHKKVPKRATNDHRALRPRSNLTEDDDDEISPYAMVKLSDLQKQQPGPSGEHRRPKSSSGTPQRLSNYNPTAPPMSESYTPRRASNPVHVRKYPVLPGHPLYAMPNKEKLTHLRSEPDGASDFPDPPDELTFDFPPPPPPDDQDGQYDPPPPDMGWLCK
ncbi:hypothetical protein CHUAL_003555 [Chamberlinius hualienensis]